jgi:hypothetical protein
MSIEDKIMDIEHSIDDPFFRILELGKLEKEYPGSKELRDVLVRQRRDSIYVLPDKWRSRIFEILKSSSTDEEKLKRLGGIANEITKGSDASTKDLYKQIIVNFIRYVKKTGSYSLSGPESPGPIPPLRRNSSSAPPPPPPLSSLGEKSTSYDAATGIEPLDWGGRARRKKGRRTKMARRKGTRRRR